MIGHGRSFSAMVWPGALSCVCYSSLHLHSSISIDIRWSAGAWICRWYSDLPAHIWSSQPDTIHQEWLSLAWELPDWHPSVDKLKFVISHHYYNSLSDRSSHKPHELAINGLILSFSSHHHIFRAPVCSCADEGPITVIHCLCPFQNALGLVFKCRNGPDPGWLTNMLTSYTPVLVKCSR